MSENAVRTAGILVFDGVEVLDFAGPYEVFSVARALNQHDESGRLFTPITIAESGAMIHTTGDLQVTPHFTIANHPPLDIVLIPGGAGTRALQTNEKVLDWIRDQSAQAELTSSVCTGSIILAMAGLLEGKPATTHWGSIERFREHFPGIAVQENVRFVDTGRIITSAGISAGIDMSLAIVARLHGMDVAWQTARYMEYHWRP